MTVHVDLPGANTYPTFRKQCQDCQYEFDFSGTYDEADNVICPECGSKSLKELYMSFPSDGPGFQDDYSKQTDRLRGGGVDECGCGSGFNL